MIIDFGCREAFDVFDAFFPALPGALAVLAVVAGLAAIGGLFARSSSFRPSDIFAGWGIVAGIMTLASVFFPQPLFFAALCLFALMAVGLVGRLKAGARIDPVWVLAIFPCLFILTAINAIGLGGYAYDDFSHWVPNALYVFQHNDLPSVAFPSIHSLYPGYPYALPFLTYLASLLAGGFLVQGGAMINFMLLFGFAAMLVETTEKQGRLKVFERLGLTALALLFAVFLNSSISAFGMTNSGDTGTMALCGALGILFWRLAESLRLKKKTDINSLSLRAALIALAFVLTKESSIFLFFILGFAFLAIAWRQAVLKPAFVRLAMIVLPALALRILWQYYTNTELGAGGGGVRILPFGAWHLSLFPTLWRGIEGEIAWKGVFFALFLVTMFCGVFSLFRPPAPWRDFALFAALVQLGYAAFFIAAFLGSDFTEYAISLAIGFHRYMLHAVFLALPMLWFAAAALGRRVKEKIEIPAVCSSPAARKGATFVSLALLPLIMSFKSDWIAMRPDPGTCRMRKLGHAVASLVPDKGRLGVVFPGNDGLAAYIVGFELALEEARTGRSMAFSWHGDNCLSGKPPDSPEVARQLVVHPETNALLYSQEGYALLKSIGFVDALGTGFLVRDENGWKPRRIYAP